MSITKANAKESLGKFICLPLRKRKQNKISRFSFVIISVRMVCCLQSKFVSPDFKLLFYNPRSIQANLPSSPKTKVKCARKRLQLPDLRHRSVGLLQGSKRPLPRKLGKSPKRGSRGFKRHDKSRKRVENEPKTRTHN